MTDLAAKLQAKDGRRLGLLAAPATAKALFPSAAKKGPYDVVVLFVRSRAELERRFLDGVNAAEGGILWIAYPKQSGAIPTDLTRDQGWETSRSAGWVPVSLVSIDADWSAQRIKYDPSLGAARAQRSALWRKGLTRTKVQPTPVGRKKATAKKRPTPSKATPARPQERAAKKARPARPGAKKPTRR